MGKGVPHAWGSLKKKLILDDYLGPYPIEMDIHGKHYLVGGFNPHLKNISQIGNLPQIKVKIKNI